MSAFEPPILEKVVITYWLGVITGSLRSPINIVDYNDS